jgi:uncharacterized Zn-binding protein involved in type VI secretion
MKFAARIGDIHQCFKSEPGPVPHVGGPILPKPGKPNVFIGGLPAAVEGTKCFCAGVPPSSISTSSKSVFINGKGAARKDDLTAHGGKILNGCLTVIIGD